MYLLNVHTLQLRPFMDEKTRPHYAILSHTWFSQDQEVNFQDVESYQQALKRKDDILVNSIESRLGFQKMKGSCKQAVKDDLEWIWIDTCCIDKKSSAELSEAINSMFKWYKQSEVCYILLSDVPSLASFEESKWFTRGWTLQELIAPETRVFFDDGWNVIGTMDEKTIQDVVSSITSIETIYLTGVPLSLACVAKKMSWASKRETTRGEDIAYSLLGIFDIHMPLLYGEGDAAFTRLQREIISHNPDPSILAWGTLRSTDKLLSLSRRDPLNLEHYVLHDPSQRDQLNLGHYGVLAMSPKDFEDCGDFERSMNPPRDFTLQITNTGVRLCTTVHHFGTSTGHRAACDLWCFSWRYPTNNLTIALVQGLQSGPYININENQYLRSGFEVWHAPKDLDDTWSKRILARISRDGDRKGTREGHTITIAEDLTLNPFHFPRLTDTVVRPPRERSMWKIF
ncbi:heterokaryon incompatibility protein-domain-containing protein [Astrocystis sublimbata]|nr:heterokaryon incompatibility protein-domain-containing protein [Astrocystis sublimbata]